MKIPSIFEKRVIGLVSKKLEEVLKDKTNLDVAIDINNVSVDSDGVVIVSGAVKANLNDILSSYFTKH